MIQVVEALHGDVVRAELVLKRKYAGIPRQRNRPMLPTFGAGTEVLPAAMMFDLTEALDGDDVTILFKLTTTSRSATACVPYEGPPADTLILGLMAASERSTVRRSSAAGGQTRSVASGTEIHLLCTAVSEPNPVALETRQRPSSLGTSRRGRAHYPVGPGPGDGQVETGRVDADIDIYFCDPHAPWQRGHEREHCESGGGPGRGSPAGWCRLREVTLENTGRLRWRALRLTCPLSSRHRPGPPSWLDQELVRLAGVTLHSAAATVTSSQAGADQLPL